MGSLYRPKLKSGKRSTIWWVKYYVNGSPIRESTETAKESEARRFLRLREGAAATGAPIPPRADRILYDELAADLRTYYQTTGRWKNLADVEDRLAHLDRFFKDHRAASITADLVTKYVAKRQAEITHLKRSTSNRTINLELSLLRRMFRLALKRGKVLRVPLIEMLQDAPPRAGFFENEQYQAVLKHLPEDLQVAVAIAYTYGWRVRSEVLPLERRQLDLRVGTLRLEPGTTKNREGRIVYLTPELKSLLAAQLARMEALQRRTGRIIPFVFPHFEGRYLGERRRGFRKAWKRACRLAGVPGRILHDFRRTAVRNLERAGVPRAVAMKITGHKTESVYRRYAIVSDADLQEATCKLAGTFSGTFQQFEVDPFR